MNRIARWLCLAGCRTILPIIGKMETGRLKKTFVRYCAMEIDFQNYWFNNTQMTLRQEMRLAECKRAVRGVCVAVDAELHRRGIEWRLDESGIVFTRAQQ